MPRAAALRVACGRVASAYVGSGGEEGSVQVRGNLQDERGRVTFGSKKKIWHIGPSAFPRLDADLEFTKVDGKDTDVHIEVVDGLKDKTLAETWLPLSFLTTFAQERGFQPATVGRADLALSQAEITRVAGRERCGPRRGECPGRDDHLDGKAAVWASVELRAPRPGLVSRHAGRAQLRGVRHERYDQTQAEGGPAGEARMGRERVRHS
jgi:hypothetical protein